MQEVYSGGGNNVASGLQVKYVLELHEWLFDLQGVFVHKFQASSFCIYSE